jgi:hypothetical protein
VIFIGMGKKVFKQEDIECIINRYVNNMESIKDISLTFKCDGSVINRVLKENGIEIIKGSAFSVDYWIKRGMTKDGAELKIKQIKPSLVEYWLNKGYSEEESKIQTELHLMNTERAFIIKYGDLEGKKLFKQKKDKDGIYNSIRRIEYWIKKGYSEDESKEIIKNKQSTFSLKTCVDKYGEVEGLEIFKNRQSKWVNTLKNKKDYNEIQKLKISTSLDSIIKKCPKNFIDEYFKINLYDGKYEFLINEVKSYDYDSFLNKIKSNIKYDSKFIRGTSKIKLFQYVFKREEEDIKFDLNNLYSVKNKQSYGTTFMTHGYVVRSLGEKLILDRLVELKIDFIYDKFYPEQKKYKYDFYLPKYNLYIEYFGMFNVKTTNRNKKILEDYKRKSKLKLDLCKNNNYNFLFSSNIDELMMHINNLKDE